MNNPSNIALKKKQSMPLAKFQTDTKNNNQNA